METLTRKEAAELLKLNPKTLDYFVRTSQIPFSRLGKRCVRFDKARLERWFHEREMVEYHVGRNNNKADG